MILYGVGMGPGDRGLVTLRAVEVLKEAEVVFEPLSGRGRRSVAGDLARDLVPGLVTVPVIFPMTGDDGELMSSVTEALRSTSPSWGGRSTLAMPVIGDSALYSTVLSLKRGLEALGEEVELRLVPGISAHSAAASLLSSFMAMRNQVLSVIPGSAGPERVLEALRACDSAALYKPSALKDRLGEVVTSSGPWERVVRVHRVGLEGERWVEGQEALEPTDDYLAVMLLWR
ncbi:Uroporphyrin-III C/tetrapyrrole (Corrin/Porphyrin) methyltransferase [Thermanaerovibrio acidaminovorans DSM 6589]|uniref:Uroporphyrin-III C/tetrapyrrole (Corrin/Porphyrin) methyltransferase n=1 Tax=Thermanaerovibrio acidaminovorans (strain ATCC 49978 / DSM 6589 / Su883) TaxID=525903 RepID=D1B7N5_THEAS|nr:Uroporphyrin-III C/tetrapyrrole (Corrin/Porphyrin) methyltransferase [Thermanaerovibrio acidaminovorans DSM 6589]